MSHRRTLVYAALAAAPLFLPRPSYAIPAWTRKTGAPCSSCHFGASNRLTKMGWDFLTRGHRMAGDQGFTEDPASINFLHYASLGARGAFTVTEDADPSSRFTTNAVTLEAGGPLIQKLSFYVSYDLYNSSDGGTDLGDAYPQYTSDLEAPDYWWARAGNFSPHINWMAARVPAGPGSVISAAPGFQNPYRVSGFEGLSAGYDTEGGLRAEVGVSNGRAVSPARNNHKDLYLSAMQMFDDYGSAVGLFAATGKYTFSAGTPATTQDADFNRIGLLAQYQRDKWETHGAYYFGESDLRAGGNHNPKAFYLEFDYNVRPDHTAFVRYDNADNDLPSTLLTPTTTTGTEGFALGYAFRYTNWSRFSISLSSSKTETPGGDNDINSASIGWNIWF